MKSCPFCGGEGNLRAYGTSHKVCWVECKKCGITTQAYDSEKEAIEVWNRRHYGKEGT